MGEAVIKVRGLRKRYGELEAVRGIDLRVERGEVFALLGPNGAGKTTTVEILEGHRARSGGDVTVLGFDPGRNEVALKERTGIVLQRTGLEPYLTVSETIDMFRGYYPQPLPLDEVLEVVGLEEQRDQRVRRLSGGQQRRLDVGRGSGGRPRVALPRRTDDGLRPNGAAWRLGDDPESARTREDGPADDALPRRGAGARRSRRDHGAGRDRGRRHPGGAGGSPTRRRSSASARRRGWRCPEELALREADEGLVERRTTDLTRDLHALTSWALAEGIVLKDLTVSRLSLEDVFPAPDR